MFGLRAAILTVASLASYAYATKSLSLDVSGPSSVDGIDNLKVVTTVTNTGNETLKILNDPRGPLSRRPTNIFTITDEAETGAKPAFTGVKVKYGPKKAVEAGSYTVLAPGESTQVEHSLGRAYSFARVGAGSYSISPSDTFLVVDDDGSISRIRADTNTTTNSTSSSSEATSLKRPHASFTTNLRGSLAASSHPPALRFARRGLYIGCSAEQRTALVDAAAQAQQYAADAAAYARNNTASTERYQTWFGVFTKERHDEVQDHFNAIDSNTFADYTYDCTCTEKDAYAYVYPDNYGYVYLCGAFWDAPMAGTDSKGGTIIHESTHFTQNAGTQDFAYGQSNVKELALSNPEDAIDNADSHEYFAENNPALG